MNYEWIGISGTILILLAFLQNSERKIRVLDGIGAAAFVLYGILIHSLSTVILNGILIVIQVAKLVKLGRKKTE